MIIPFLLVSFRSDMRINTIRLMPPTCDSRKGFTFLSQLKFFGNRWQVEQFKNDMHPSNPSLPIYIRTYRQAGINAYRLGRDSELLPAYFHHTFFLQVISLHLCSAPVHRRLLDLHQRCRCETQGDEGVDGVRLNKTPWFKGNKNGVTSAEMSMQTLDIRMLYFHALHPHVIAYSGRVVFDGTRFPPRCLQVRHQIQIWKMHWSETPSKMEGQKCWKETNSKVVIYSDHLRSCRHDVINVSFHMKWWNTTAMTWIFTFFKGWIWTNTIYLGYLIPGTILR